MMVEETSNSTYVNVGKYSGLDGLYFLFYALLSGAFFLHLQRRGYNVLPVQALQFLFGMCTGLLHEYTKTGQDPLYYQGGLGDLSESIELWNRIDPHLLAAIFLPALIFSDAMQVDFHLFRRVFLQAALLATVGVGLQMCGMAFLATYYLGSTGIIWDASLCFAFGAALSATDPVAVVVMLESVQAPAKLTTLMSGESHLSDLVALVSFNIFVATAKNSAYYTTDKLVSYVLSMLFGGPALGLGFGLLTLFAIQRCSAPNNEEDTQIQIVLTVVCAYFSFIVSENNVNGNGVVATVSSALIISAYAWPSFSNPEAIRHVWKTIEFFAAAIVFCFGGMAFGVIAYRYSGGEYLPATLYGTCLFLWLMLYAVRAGVLLVLFPLLRKLGYGMRLNEALALTWGSLRGAVAIVLGLVVFETDTVNARISPALQDPKRDSVQFFFLVAGIVFLSIIVNSSTAPLVMKAFKVLSKSDVQKLLLRGIKLRIHQRAEESFAEITKDDEFKAVQREKLARVITAFDDKSAERFLRHHLKKEQFWNRCLVAMRLRARAEPERITVTLRDGLVCDVELLEVVRELFLDIVKAGYWEMIADGTLPKNSAATRTLLQSVDIAKDEVERPLSDLDLLNLTFSEEDANKTWHARVFAFIDSCLPSWVHVDDYLGEQVHQLIQQNNVYAATCFVRSHQTAQRKLARYVGDDESADSPEELVVIGESQDEVAKALQFLKVCSTLESEIVDLVTTKKVGSRVLAEQRDLIDHLFKQGVLDERGESTLQRQVEDQLYKLERLTIRGFEARNSIVQLGEERLAVQHQISAGEVSSKQVQDDGNESAVVYNKV